jgi:hypothetical protein
MADTRGLKLVGLIFASITITVIATTTVVVRSYADGVYAPETAARSSDRSSAEHRPF